MTGPWISGESLSPSRLNVHGGSATLATGFSTNTLQPESGTTVQLLSDLSVQQTVAAQRVELGGPPSTTSGLLALRANSAQTDYLFLQDATGAKSNFLLGLRTGDSNFSQVDGLNLYDASHNTMIARFSSSSIRFYPPVVAPVFDTGGALSSTYNAALFAIGSSKESQIQAAVTGAAADGIARVYVPANLYPYSCASVSFNTRVQMVREGGDWSVFDIKAYGAAGNRTQDDTNALNGALSAASAVGGGIVYVPTGQYLFTSPLYIPQQVILRGVSRIASLLTASTSFSTNTAMVTLGAPAETLTFGARLEQLTIDCSSVTSSIGVYSDKANEFCGLFEVEIANFGTFGSQFTSGLAQNYTLRELYLLFGPRSDASAIALEINAGAADIRGVDSVTVDSLGTLFNYAGIRLNNAPGGFLSRLHLENTVNGIVIGDRVACGGMHLTGVTGASGMSNVVLISNANANQNIVVTSVQRGSATNAIVDQLSGVTISDTDVGIYALGNGATRPILTTSGTVPNRVNALWIGPVSQFSFAQRFNFPASFTNAATDYAAMWQNSDSANAFGIAGQTAPRGIVFATNNQYDLSLAVGGTRVLSTVTTSSSVSMTRAQVQDGSAIQPGVAFNSDVSLGWYRSGASTMALSYGSLNLNQTRLVSVRTQGSLDSTTLAQGELAISIAVASGASLALRSGNTIYYWTSSASTKG